MTTSVKSMMLAGYPMLGRTIKQLYRREQRRLRKIRMARKQRRGWA